MNFVVNQTYQTFQLQNTVGEQVRHKDNNPDKSLTEAAVSRLLQTSRSTFSFRMNSVFKIAGWIGKKRPHL